MSNLRQDTDKPKEGWFSKAGKILLYLFWEMMPYAFVAMPVLVGKVYASVFAAAGVALLLIPLWVWLYGKRQDKGKVE